MAGPSIFKWYKDDLAREDHMIGGMLMLMAATLPPNAGRESPPPRIEELALPSLAQTYKVRAMSGQILDALPK